MPNGKSSDLAQKVPTYIPLSDAAQKYGISEEALTQLIEAGKIEAVQLPSGELLVAAENGKYKTKEEIITEEFSELQGYSAATYPVKPSSSSRVREVQLLLCYFVHRLLTNLFFCIKLIIRFTKPYY